MMSPLLRCLVSTVAAGALIAQGREPAAGLVALHQACLDASTDAVVLNIAAHPDDEASRTRLMLRRKYGARVVTAYSTYGDGGQNAIGREIGPELAFIRVRETLRAAEMSDVGVEWLGMEDFGFSKTLEETLAFWGEDRLRDAMRDVIQRVKPDIIVTNHSIGSGHGHHRASAWAILEVLKERTARGEAVPPMFGRSGPEDAWVTVDPGLLDPMRGDTYARLAHDAWVQHESQGPWGPHNPMRVGKEWWKLVYPEGRERQKVDGWDSWLPNRGPNLLPRGSANLPRDELRAKVIELCANEAVDGGGAQAAALQRVLLALEGVRAEIWLENDTVPLGGKGKAHVIVHGHDKVTKIAVSCEGVAAKPVNAPVRSRRPGGAASGESTTPTPTPAPAPQPLAGRYSVEFSPRPGANGTAPPGPETTTTVVGVQFMLGEVPIELTRELHYTTVDPIEVKLDRNVILIPKGEAVRRTFSASVRTHRESEPDTPVRLSMGPGIQATSAPGRLQLTRNHNEARLLVRATIDPAELTADAGILVGYRDHAARVHVVPVDVKVPEGLHVGLVRGPDDTTERTLADLGIDTTVLERDTLMTVQLEKFSTLLLDIRVNYHRPDLAEMRGRILEFCRAGGRVVVMYHKPREWNARGAEQSLAPFSFTVGRERVTEEDAEIKFLVPEHRILQHPNVITSGDFEGWVQERGLNFPTRWDKAWTPLLEMKDSGAKKPSHGSLLYTEYGKGDYIYCSLAIYRQLRVGNAGAARLLVNLLAQ